MTLWKGLIFFRAVSPSESPKVMGLMGIYDPDALCYFNRVTLCPWCGKVGQNGGHCCQLLEDGALQTGPHV